MTVSAAMIDHLAGNVTFLAELWKMVARDGTVAAYAAHQWNITFDSVLYVSAPIEPTRSTTKIGLDADSAELNGVFDDVIIEQDVRAGKWRGARITKEIINYLDTSIGSVSKQVGFAGKFSISGDRFTVEFLSLTSLLSQEIGDLTSPLDRRRRLSELGIDITSFTHARTVTTFTDRRNFTVDGAAQADGYFKNGVVLFTSGDNDDLEMEIKDNVGNNIELQLPMPYNIANGNTVTLYRGYLQTRDDAKAVGAMIGLEGEPDLPGLNEVYTYPQD